MSVLFSSSWFETSIRERRHGWISRWNHIVLTHGESMETTVLGFRLEPPSRRLSKLLRYGQKSVALLMIVPQRLLGVVVWTVAQFTGNWLVPTHMRATIGS